jgi:hypothetical protein
MFQDDMCLSPSPWNVDSKVAIQRVSCNGIEVHGARTFTATSRQILQSYLDLAGAYYDKRGSSGECGAFDLSEYVNRGNGACEPGP